MLQHIPSAIVPAAVTNTYIQPWQIHIYNRRPRGYIDLAWASALSVKEKGQLKSLNWSAIWIVCAIIIL